MRLRLAARPAQDAPGGSVRPGGSAVAALAGLAVPALAGLAALAMLAGCSPPPPGAAAGFVGNDPAADVARVAAEEETSWSDLPGVNRFDELTPELQLQVASRANRAKCDCGCVGHSVAACLHLEKSCQVAQRIAAAFVDDALATQLAAPGASVAAGPSPEDAPPDAAGAEAAGATAGKPPVRPRLAPAAATAPLVIDSPDEEPAEVTEGTGAPPADGAVAQAAAAPAAATGLAPAAPGLVPGLPALVIPGRDLAVGAVPAAVPSAPPAGLAPGTAPRPNAPGIVSPPAGLAAGTASPPNAPGIVSPQGRLPGAAGPISAAPNVISPSPQAIVPLSPPGSTAPAPQGDPALRPPGARLPPRVVPDED